MRTRRQIFLAVITIIYSTTFLIWLRSEAKLVDSTLVGILASIGALLVLLIAPFLIDILLAWIYTLEDESEESDD